MSFPWRIIFSYYKLVILLYYNVFSPQAWLLTLVAELKLQSLVHKFRVAPSGAGCDLGQPLATFGLNLSAIASL